MCFFYTFVYEIGPYIYFIDKTSSSCGETDYIYS